MCPPSPGRLPIFGAPANGVEVLAPGASLIGALPQTTSPRSPARAQAEAAPAQVRVHAGSRQRRSLRSRRVRCWPVSAAARPLPTLRCSSRSPLRTLAVRGLRRRFRPLPLAPEGVRRRGLNVARRAPFGARRRSIVRVRQRERPRRGVSSVCVSAPRSRGGLALSLAQTAVSAAPRPDPEVVTWRRRYRVCSPLPIRGTPRGPPRSLASLPGIAPQPEGRDAPPVRVGGRARSAEASRPLSRRAAARQPLDPKASPPARRRASVLLVDAACPLAGPEAAARPVVAAPSVECFSDAARGPRRVRA